MAVTYADLSHHQGSVDLAAYARAGHDRVMLKCTEGTGFLDTTFTARWRQAGTLGLKRGAYHFLRNALPGAEQWAWFISAVRRAGPLQPGDWLCLDSEDPATPGRAVAASQEFTRAATLAGFVDGEVYTGRWYADPNGLTAAVFPVGWRRLWLSDYTPAQVALPAGWTQAQLVALQFTDKATVPGIGTPCDYNRVVNDWHTTEDDMALTPAETALLADIKAGVDDLQAKMDRTRTVTLPNISALITSQAAALAALVKAGDTSLATAIGSAQAAVLGWLTAHPTEGMTDAERIELAGDIAAKLAAVGVPVDADAVLDALATRLTD